jgi:predicted ribosomally synthesized peptide with SipW-like signal peptide
MSRARILLSFAVLAVALGALSLGGTGAFFSDTESSRGNVFNAGDIDLKVDNESYYNGVLNASTTWQAKDLTIEKFFDFNDVKPADYGEDTISLHINTNDSYLCADVTLTSNDDNGINEPESEVDDTDGSGNGELAQAVNFLWWGDDGDNVLESDETVISEGSIGALPLNQPRSVTLADSVENIWTGEPGPVVGDTTYYIGKAWCFGDIAGAPLPQDDYDSPADDNNDNDTSGEPEDGGIHCNGAMLGNETQTDSLTADVTFSAVQSRNNATFRCAPEIAACIPSTTNIFVNGGFETPAVTDPALWDVFLAAVSGWTVEWRADLPTTFSSFPRPEPGNFELHSGVLGAAHSGSQYIELDSDWNGHSSGPDGEPASTVISQTIPTVHGATYTVDYWFAPRPNTPAQDNVVEVRYNGVLLDTAGPLAGGGGNLTVGDWQHRGPFNIVATSTGFAVVSFTDAGTANSLGSFIDDVTVLQTVCPVLDN